MYTLIEPCCGSAALSLHYAGAKRSLLPYQGSKWRYRRALAALVERLGHQGPPAEVHLHDPGPWGRTWRAIRLYGWAPLIAALDAMAQRDPAELYAQLQGSRVSPVSTYTPELEIEAAAIHLFLQRLAFSGKAVGVSGGVWCSPGLNTTSAYGLAATERFGAVQPMVPSLVRVLREYERELRLPLAVTTQDGAEAPLSVPKGPLVVYLDPPYQGSTPYPDATLNRRWLVFVAKGWAAWGATVIVSEAEPVDDLVKAGWTAERLADPRTDVAPFRGKQAEWVTFTKT